VSIITTVAAKIGSQVYETGFHTTTPSPFAIQKYLRLAVDNNNEFFVLETTSHALDQYRVFGVCYLVSVITNITHEHLQYHKTYENYVKAKAKLIKWSKFGYINKDDMSFEYLEKILDMSAVKTYGLEKGADFILNISEKLNLSMPHFNKYNFLAAYVVCRKIGLTDSQIFSAMKTYTLPEGRMELIYDSKFKVIVDFAHTPNSLHEVLPSIRKKYLKHGRLIHVFGCAAFRDDSKRSIMGRESGTLADLTIVTEEDYRTEDPRRIFKMIATGLEEAGSTFEDKVTFGKNVKTFTYINNRLEAIKKALEIAHKGDVIILTGKGHEKSLCRGKKEFPWSDKVVTLDLINGSSS
jgi:UDP-N-acetylmuramoyl-L-alanyl-D-glutamate--2,6-diaminopimelate ligase